MSTLKKKTVSKQKDIKKKPIFKGYFCQIRSRHPSHDILRKNPDLRFPFKSLVRFGSTTELDDTAGRVQINSTEAIKNSSSKLKMKKCFDNANIKTAEWWILVQKLDHIVIRTDKDVPYKDSTDLSLLPYPIVAKHHFGSRGTGNYLLNSKQELQNWLHGKDLTRYIFEKFYNYVKEYRLHVTSEGCFYTCRKMLKADIPAENRWFRNDSNSVWVLEENPLFDKPKNWQKIVENCVNALKAVGLDIGACDVKVQSTKTQKNKERDNIDFIVIEINSAASFGEITKEKYLIELNKLIKNKKNA